MMREEFDGTGIVFDPDNNRAMTLNASGVAVWRVLSTGGTAADAAVGSDTRNIEAAVRLRETFRGVTPEQAAADVRKFIGALKEKSLLADD